MKHKIGKDLVGDFLMKSIAKEKPVISDEKYVLPPRPSQCMIAFEKGIQPKMTFEDTRLLSINGWLARDGTLYCCKWQEHDYVARYFDVEFGFELTMLGFIRLSQMRFLLHESDVSASDSMINTINMWHGANNLDRNRFQLDLKKQANR
jgi:hypothetical protein